MHVETAQNCEKAATNQSCRLNMQIVQSALLHPEDSFCWVSVFSPLLNTHSTFLLFLFKFKWTQVLLKNELACAAAFGLALLSRSSLKKILLLLELSSVLDVIYVGVTSAFRADLDQICQSGVKAKWAAHTAHIWYDVRNCNICPAWEMHIALFPNTALVETY